MLRPRSEPYKAPSSERSSLPYLHTKPMLFRTALPILLLLLIVPILHAQNTRFGPTVAVYASSYGSEGLVIEFPTSIDPAFGISARFFDNLWRLRTEVLAQPLSVEVEESRRINAAQTQERIQTLEQFGLGLTLGAEYHTDYEGFRPFFAGGLHYNVLLSYELINTTRTITGGNATEFSRTDDDASGGEYGVYASAGLAGDHYSLELRLIAGSRNRPDVSRSLFRLGLVGAYLF